MINRARVRQFKEGVGFVHLLQICLQESSRYDASKHRKSGFGREITGVVGLGEDSVDSKMMVEFGRPSLHGESSRGWQK